MDVTFKEDENRSRKGNGGGNFSIVRKVDLNMVRRDKESKNSLKIRRFKAGLNPQIKALEIKAKNCFVCNQRTSVKLLL